jgi:hypothetical protein
MKHLLAAALVLPLLLGFAPHARADDPPKEDAAYLQLVEECMKQDPSKVNWGELRTLYSQTSFYKPYGGMVMWPAFDEAGKTAAMTGAPESVKNFQDMQRQQFANFKSHVAAIKLATAMGSRASFVDPKREQAALEGIADSIVASGDGKTPDHAYKVITSEEEDLIVKTYIGAAVKRHQEAEKDGHHYEVLYFANSDPKSKKDGVAIFNIDVQFAHEQAANAFPGIKN